MSRSDRGEWRIAISSPEPVTMAPRNSDADETARATALDKEREALIAESFLLSIFQAELEDQCLYGKMAGAQIEAGLTIKRSAQVWFGIHGILVAGGNAAKLLWGSGRPPKREKIETEREPFREKVGAGDNSPLRCPRMRNAFEHLDEEISRWSKKDLGHYVGRRVDWETDESLPLESSFGRFDPETWQLTFLEKEPVSIKALRTELDEISVRLSPWR